MAATREGQAGGPGWRGLDAVADANDPHLEPRCCWVSISSRSVRPSPRHLVEPCPIEHRLRAHEGDLVLASDVLVDGVRLDERGALRMCVSDGGMKQALGDAAPRVLPRVPRPEPVSDTRFPPEVGLGGHTPIRSNPAPSPAACARVGYS